MEAKPDKPLAILVDPKPSLQVFVWSHADGLVWSRFRGG